LITENALERHLLWPRAPLGVLAFCRPNLSYVPCVVLASAAAGAYYVHYHIGFWRIGLHLAAVLCGVFVLDAISFIYRLTSFWTTSIVRVRNSNPSFKIMVRPLGAFQGKLTILLLTLFPALYITAVPASLLSPEARPYWLAAGFLAAGLLWLYAHRVWTVGVRRYARIAA
jgi:ABC-2 type transport system permease protein